MKGIILALLVVILASASATLGYFLSPKPQPSTPVIKQALYVYERPSPPKIVYVRGNEWTIYFGYLTFPNGKSIDDYLNKEQAVGASMCLQQAIMIHTGLPIADERETIFHELLHAGSCDGKSDIPNIQFYNSVSVKNHKGLDRFSGFTLDLLRENPELARYLIG
jgi:hypothetical protein